MHVELVTDIKQETNSGKRWQLNMLQTSIVFAHARLENRMQEFKQFVEVDNFEKILFIIDQERENISNISLDFIAKLLRGESLGDPNILQFLDVRHQATEKEILEQAIDRLTSMRSEIVKSLSRDEIAQVRADQEEKNTQIQKDAEARERQIRAEGAARVAQIRAEGAARVAQI